MNPEIRYQPGSKRRLIRDIGIDAYFLVDILSPSVSSNGELHVTQQLIPISAFILSASLKTLLTLVPYVTYLWSNTNVNRVFKDAVIFYHRENES